MAGKSQHRRGQAVPEFALILPVLLVILLIAIDFGRLFLGWIDVQNMTRIAANFAATHPSAWSQGIAAQQADYTSQIQQDATAINCALPTPLPTPSFPDGNVLNGRAQVSISCGFRPLTPLISAVVGSTVEVGATAVFPIRAGLLPVTPGSTPAPTPPGPTPTPGTGQCTVPTFIGTPSGDAPSAWATAGFAPVGLTVSIGTYTINSETPPGVDGSIQSCSGFQMAVGP